MKRWLKRISLLMSAFLLAANVNAITVKASSIGGQDAYKIASAMQKTAELKRRAGLKSGYAKGMSNGDVVFIRSFSVTNLDAPKKGTLLDSSATVVADNGVTWDVPVLWANMQGTLMKIAIDDNDVFRCYPIIAFYLPDGCNLMFGENSAFDINMPDFVTKLIKQCGVATMTNPLSGVTYISPIIPGQTGFVANTPAGYYDTPTSTESESVVEEDKPYVPEEERGKGGSSALKPRQYEKYTSNLDEKASEELIAKYSDDNTKEKIGTENLAWLISFVQNVVEPEAVDLLCSKFPAYKTAASKNELSKKIGLYVYYDAASSSSSDSGSGSGTSSDTGAGDSKRNSSTVAYVSSSVSGGDVSLKLGINAAYLFAKNELTGETVFSGDAAYDLLDNTVVHEMMHALMDDYTRTGMTGQQYNETTKEYSTNASNEYPDWFSEGMATAVDNAYQYWNSSFHNNYGYDDAKGEYTQESLQAKYLEQSGMQIANSSAEDNKLSAYASGYLANVYLGYLAAIKYDKKDALKENTKKNTYTIDSKVILSGVNHILEELHGGKTLDEVIKEISPKSDGTAVYGSTDEFTNKFIATKEGSDGDGGSSAYFCMKLLNYLEAASEDDEVANGSILWDFQDTRSYQLSKDLLKNKINAYKTDEGKDEVKSTVDPQKALGAGGKTEKGVVSGSTASSGSSSDNSSQGTDSSGTGSSTAAKDVAKPDSEVGDEASIGSSEDEPEKAEEGVADEENAAGTGASDEEAADAASLESSEEPMDEKTEGGSAGNEMPTPPEKPVEPIEGCVEEPVIDPFLQAPVEEAPAVQEPAADPVLEEPVVAEPDPEEVHPFIISEAEPEDSGDDSSGDNNEEQVLDAIPSDGGDDDFDAEFESE